MRCIVCKPERPEDFGAHDLESEEAIAAESDRCMVCTGWDCCNGPPSAAKISTCISCGEDFCIKCRRWIPNCQRGNC